VNTNFIQFVATIPATAQDDLILRGRTTWADAGENEVIFTWPELRRKGLVKFPKARNVFKAGSLGYIGLMELSHRKAAEHVAKFEAQAEKAKEGRDAIKALKAVRELLGS
jgi:hypothetical protein